MLQSTKNWDEKENKVHFDTVDGNVVHRLLFYWCLIIIIIILRGYDDDYS